MAEKSKKKGSSNRKVSVPKAGPKRRGTGKVLQKIKMPRGGLFKYEEQLRDIRTTPEQRANGRYEAELRKRFAYTGGGYKAPTVTIGIHGNFIVTNNN